jgi:phosphotransferase system enzyme I (PtsI)
MVTHRKEIKKTREIIDQITSQTGNDNYDRNIPLGIMIETPAAAIMADKLAEESDFFSIGSNDLAQYVLAADRVNHNLNDYYRWLDPSILKMIVGVIDSAKAQGIPVSICGEVASNPNAIPFLIWAGIDTLSVNPAYYTEVRDSIRKYDNKKFSNTIASIIDKNSDIDLIDIILELNDKK